MADKKTSKNIRLVLVFAAAVLVMALFIRGGEVITAYQVQTTNQSATTLNISSLAPTMENVQCYDYNSVLLTSMGTNPLALKGGATAMVICNGTGNDNNGGETINGTIGGSTTGRAYETSQGFGCSGDQRNCYVNSTCAALGIKNATAQYFECRYFVQYHADNTSQAGSWTGWMSVTDGASYGNSTTIFDVDELLAVGVPGVLAFGSAIPGEKLNMNRSHAVSNYGNVQVDLKLNGSAIGMDCTSAQDVPVGNIKYNCTDSANLYDGQGTPLSTSAASDNCTTFNLAESQSTGPGAPTPTSKDTYWGVAVPLGVAGTCQGTIWFTAILG